MAMQYGVNYDVLLRADMSDADMIMAGVLLVRVQRYRSYQTLAVERYG